MTSPKVTIQMELYPAKLKYDIYTKLSPESYQIQFWYDSGGNF